MKIEKIIYVFFLSLLFFNKPSNAQYHKLIDTNKLWNYYDCYAGPPPNYTTLYRFATDTIINGKKYFIPETTQDSVHWTKKKYYFREVDSTKRIYLLYNNSEGLIYDFSLNAGDSVTILNPLCGANPSVTIHALSIDSVQIDGAYRKIINADNSCTWVEGIGDKLGLYHPGYTITGTCLSLVCYYENNSLKYANPSYNSCFQVFASINEKENQKEILLKNNKNNFYILQAKSRFEEIVLFNILGEKIKLYTPLSNQCEIDMSIFNPGVYFLSGRTDDKLFFNIKIIKS